MLTLKAHLLNIFTGNDFTNQQTGEIAKGKTKLQLLASVPLKNGGHKNQLIDLTIPIEKLPLYEDKINMDVEVEVALMGEAKFYGI